MTSDESTYEVTSATTDQLAYLFQHWYYQWIEANVVNIRVPTKDVDNFVEYCDEHNMQYRLT